METLTKTVANPSKVSASRESLLPSWIFQSSLYIAPCSFLHPLANISATPLESRRIPEASVLSALRALPAALGCPPRPRLLPPSAAYMRYLRRAVSNQTVEWKQGSVTGAGRSLTNPSHGPCCPLGTLPETQRGR